MEAKPGLPSVPEVSVVIDADVGDELPQSRAPALRDLSDRAPFGCTLKKYLRRSDGLTVFTGVLPPGMTDADGSHSKTVSWEGPRAKVDSEEQAFNVILEWLRDNSL